jgi:hypothetical protein
MDEEIYSIERNDTWDLVDFDKDKYCIGVKWVYKIKVNEKGEIEKYKAILVEKGFSQQPRFDYGETFAPITKLDTMGVILAITSQNMWKVYQIEPDIAIASVFIVTCKLQQPRIEGNTLI